MCYVYHATSTLSSNFQGLLLLIQLTKGNANIQKIVVFENAFEKLLEIVYDEGMSDGGKFCQLYK